MTEQELHDHYFKLYELASKYSEFCFQIACYDTDPEAENEHSLAELKAMADAVLGEILALRAGV